MEKLTLTQVVAGLTIGELTAVQLTAAALAQIADDQGEGSRTFTHVYTDWAQQQALAADRRRAAGDPLSALDGVPVSVKDLFDVAGEVTAAGSRVLVDAPVANRHSAVVERLLQAGAVVIGKTNGPSCGTLIGTGLITLVTVAMSAEDFQQWGWRIPFLLSLVLVIFGLWLRRGVGETPAFLKLEASKDVTHSPIREVFTQHRRPLLIAGGSRIGSDVLYALVVVFTLTYVTTVLNLPRPLALAATMLGAIGNAITVPMFGALSDRFGRRPVYIGGALAAMVWAFVFFMLLDSSQPVLICLAVVVGLLIHAAMYGPQAAFITEQFPTRVRYAGSSLAYTLAGIIGGGFAPLIIASLFKSYDSTLAISAYVVVALLITLWAVIAAKETAHKPL